MITEILIEQVNVSDNEYTLVEVCFKSGDKIRKGDHILSYESSKSIYDYEAEESGYLFLNPDLEIDESYDVGYKIGVISDTQLLEDDQDSIFEALNDSQEQLEYEVNFTKRASKLFEESSVDISHFRGKDIVTEDHVLEVIRANELSAATDISNFTESKSVNIERNEGSKRLAVLGAGNAALQLFDATCSNDKYKIIVFYETNQDYKYETLFGVEIKKVGGVEEIINDFNDNLFDEIIISFSGNIEARSSIFNQLIEADVEIGNVIHSTAVISENVVLGVGNLIFANVRIGPFSIIGHNNVISANCSIEHNNVLGDGNTFGPAVVFSGSCIIGNMNRFGTMIGVEPLVKIGSKSVIASGLILSRNVDNNKLVRSLNKIEIIDY
jgi:acetyltransferase-like isoleucine patch superfamily enzyme